MGFSSIDDLVSEITGGKFIRSDWNKITLAASAYTAGRWYDMSNLAGTPIANAWAGTSLAYTACAETTGNGTQIFGIPHGGAVSTDTKHLLNASVISAVATAVPSQLMLVDMCGYWPGINNNTTSPQTLTGTPSLRYTNGAGVRAYLVQTVAAGAATQNITLSYTNTVPTSGRSLPVTVTTTASGIIGHITHAGVAANNYGPFLPLAAGDLGVSNVATITFASATTGTAALVLAKPIMSIPLPIVSVSSERDFLNQLPSLPRIVDGANLTWLYFAGAATATNTNFYGSLEFGWG